MSTIELNTWLTRQLTALDYQVRDIEQAAVLSGLFRGSIERGLCHVRERIEDVARIVR